MWKVVITEIQDASTLDPVNAPLGAFFVSTERFARTVDYLDLPCIISVINRMQSSSREDTRRKGQVLSEKIPHLDEPAGACRPLRPPGSINFRASWLATTQ
jgi:hypothetical protein